MEIEKDLTNKLNLDNNDSEEEEVDATPLVLDFDIELQSNVDTHTLLIGLYGLGSLYIAGKTLNQGQKIGHINFQKSKQRALADIYSLKSGEVVVLFNEILDKNLDYHFAQSLFQKIKPKKIAIFDHINQNVLDNYNPESDNKAKGLRVVNNSASKMTNSLEIGTQMEVGNAVKGIAADVLIETEYIEIPCDLYLGVVEDVEFAIYDLKVFEPLSAKYVPLRENWNESEVKKSIKKYNQNFQALNWYL